MEMAKKIDAIFSENPSELSNASMVDYVLVPWARKISGQDLGTYEAVLAGIAPEKQMAVAELMKCYDGFPFLKMGVKTYVPFVGKTLYVDEQTKREPVTKTSEFAFNLFRWRENIRRKRYGLELLQKDWWRVPMEFYSKTSGLSKEELEAIPKPDNYELFLKAVHITAPNSIYENMATVFMPWLFGWLHRNVYADKESRNDLRRWAVEASRIAWNKHWKEAFILALAFIMIWVALINPMTMYVSFIFPIYSGLAMPIYFLSVYRAFFHQTVCRLHERANDLVSNGWFNQVIGVSQKAIDYRGLASVSNKIAKTANEIVDKHTGLFKEKMVVVIPDTEYDYNAQDFAEEMAKRGTKPFIISTMRKDFDYAPAGLIITKIEGTDLLTKVYINSNKGISRIYFEPEAPETQKSEEAKKILQSLISEGNAGKKLEYLSSCGVALLNEISLCGNPSIIKKLRKIGIDNRCSFIIHSSCVMNYNILKVAREDAGDGIKSDNDFWKNGAVLSSEIVQPYEKSGITGFNEIVQNALSYSDIVSCFASKGKILVPEKYRAYIDLQAYSKAAENYDNLLKMWKIAYIQKKKSINRTFHTINLGSSFMHGKDFAETFLKLSLSKYLIKEIRIELKLPEGEIMHFDGDSKTFFTKLFRLLNESSIKNGLIENDENLQKIHALALETIADLEYSQETAQYARSLFRTSRFSNSIELKVEAVAELCGFILTLIENHRNIDLESDKSIIDVRKIAAIACAA